MIFRLLSGYPNVLLFVGIMFTQYFTAAALQFNINPNYTLLGTSGFALLCGSYFFVANAFFRTSLRNAMFCKGDPITRKKMDGYSTDYITNRHISYEEESTDGPSFSAPHTAQRHVPQRHRSRYDDRAATGQDLNYMNDYLGGQRNYGRTGLNPVPLSLFGHMQINGRVRGRDMGPNPAYQMDLATSTDV